MPVTVDIPSEGVSVDFPDSMSQGDIQQVVRRKFGKKPVPEGGAHTEAGDLPRDTFQPAMGESKLADEPTFKDLSSDQPLTLRHFTNERPSTTAGGPPISLPEGAAKSVWNEISEELTNARVTLPRAKITEQDSALMTVGKEAVNIGASIPEFFTSDAGILAAVAGSAAPVATAGAFTADMLKTLGEQVVQTHKDWQKMTRNQKLTALTDMAGTGVMALLTGKHTVSGVLDKTVPARALAKQIRETPLTPAPESTSAALVRPGERTEMPLDRVAELIRPVAPLTAAALAEAPKVGPRAEPVTTQADLDKTVADETVKKTEEKPAQLKTDQLNQDEQKAENLNQTDVTPPVTEESTAGPESTAERPTAPAAEPAALELTHLPPEPPATHGQLIEKQLQEIAKTPNGGYWIRDTYAALVGEHAPQDIDQAIETLVQNYAEHPEELKPEVDKYVNEYMRRLEPVDEPAGPTKKVTSENLTPAILVEGNPVTGANHASIRDKVRTTMPTDALESAMAKENEGFVDENGNFVSRSDAAKWFKEKTGKEPAKPGELHSEDLRDAGLLSHVEEKPAVPPPEIGGKRAAQSKVLADKLREQFKTTTGGKVFTGPVDLINAAVEVAAKILEAGGKVADALEAGLKHLRENYTGKDYKTEIDEQDFIKRFDPIKQLESGADVTGVAQRVREKVAASGQEELAPTGEGIAAKDSVERGDKMLASDPGSAEKVMAAFEADPSKALSADAMALARAQLRQLAIKARDAEQKFGINSPEYEAAFKARSEWAARAKKMQTEWHKTGMAQQGEQDIDTGSFTGLRSAYVDDTGKDFTPQQATTAKNLAARVKSAEDAEAKAKAELKSHLEKQQPSQMVDPWVLEVADRIAKRVSTAADAARNRLAERRKNQGKTNLPLGGADPSLLSNVPDLAIIGAEKITKGASEFLRWADDMRRELGDMDEGILRTIYEAAKNYLTGEISKEPGSTPERTAAAQKQAGITDIAVAEQRALDAANKTVRENAVRLADAESKTRVAKTEQDMATAKVQEDAARKAHDASMKSAKDAAIRLAKAESESRTKAAAARPPKDQEKVAQRALDAANDRVKKSATDAAKAEDKARVARSATAKKWAEAQAKSAQKRLDAAHKSAREAAVKAARAEVDARINPENRVWEKVKEYLDQGIDGFDDMRNKVATELGMSVKQVTDILTRNPRSKYLADQAWLKQQALRRFQQQAKRWLKSTSTPGYQRALASVPRALFAIRVGFHGTVALGTHAPMVAFQPPFWRTYVRDFGRMYGMVGGPAYYERQVQDLVRRPNYITARRSGLVNDPALYEEYAVPGVGEKVKQAVDKVSPKIVETFDKITTMGNRGYAVLKILRQDMFDQHWDSLPKTARTPDMAKAISDGVNHATGVIKAAAPTGANIALFAPRLEASRVMWLAGDPLKAAATFLNWKEASQADKYFAVQQVKEKAWTAGTLFGLLALNQGVLSLTGSNQKVNFDDPFHSDFLKFKAAGMTASYGNAMISMARLPVRLYRIRTSDGGKLKNLIYPDEDTYTVLGEYGRSQLSPFASLAADLWLKADWQNRPLPNSSRPVPKRLKAQGVKPYTWPEFWAEQSLPIPAQEAMREVWKKGMGMSDEQVKNTFKAVATISVMSATGARLTDDVDIQPGHKTKKN